MIKIAIFASGSGSNAENIVKYFEHKGLLTVSVIVTNNPNAIVLERAKRLNIPTLVISKAEMNEGTLVATTLLEMGIQWIVLAGYLLKIPQSIIESFEGRIINIHPALLPKFGGKGMYGERVHQAVVDAGETESGITIHYVNEHYDEGTTIFQAKCEVLPTDSANDVATKVHALEYLYFPEVIEQVLRK
ncbi:MAG: phosphoribosylglycinamide formyltransferase [Bacteroidales bacterium]|nr:phosphoribosylglycinamide formyltransferase [Bacteroidales bacterium]